MKNKVVLVTGGSGGIGSEIAQKFALEGAFVCIQYSSNDKSARELEDKFENIFKLKQDFNDKSIDLIERVIMEHGRLDVLVNCAGVMANTSIFDMDHEEFDSVFNTNTKVPMMLSSKAFSHMKDQRFGRIINISSFTVRFGMGRNNSIHYAASKAALETLTTGLSRLGAKFNVLVNTIRPGVIMTDMQRNREGLEDRIDIIPVKRPGTPKEIADMVYYLSSPSADFITGQTLTIAGGE